MWDSSTSIFLRIFGNHDGNISIQNWSRWEISEEGDDEGWPWERLDPDGWFHHAIVVFIPMSIVSYGEPIIYLFGLLNMAQHAITYPVLLAKTLKVSLCSATSTLLLILELIQMIVGLFLGGYTLYVIKIGGNCIRHPVSIAFLNFIFVSLGVVAAKLLLQKFVSGRRKLKDN
ncbi:hypothetical protein Fcan01_06641 [Folsomia candida]|uniref:Uncharacterized protein n=1 Tax=Folsomia candida TaxID=158441 RepID=A0A226EP56_FOLCA|nr:hypothetical protein Fcan01_06641 [Folsomia candida]